jgi:hypothetical protein
MPKPKRSTDGMVLPFREGWWIYSGGYRRRALELLDRLERRNEESREVFRRLEGVKDFEERRRIAREARPVPDLAVEVFFLDDSVILYSCLAIESFLNYYGVVRLGEAFYVANYERLSATQKIAALLATCCGALVRKDSEIVTVVRQMFARRNALVHPTAREPKGDTPVARATHFVESVRQNVRDIEQPRAAVADMERFFVLMRKYDPAVKPSEF